MVNALFVMIVFLLQLNKDNIHVKWPLGVKTNITYDEKTQEVTKSGTSYTQSGTYYAVCVPMVSLQVQFFNFSIFFCFFLFIFFCAHQITRQNENLHIDSKMFPRKSMKIRKSYSITKR